MVRYKAEVKDLFENQNRFPVYQISNYALEEYIPYDMIASHENQAWANHGQSLATLAERGGLTWGEIQAILEGKRWGQINPDEEEAKSIVMEHVARHLGGRNNGDG